MRIRARLVTRDRCLRTSVARPLPTLSDKEVDEADRRRFPERRLEWWLEEEVAG